jgi:hypothetical protein
MPSYINAFPDHRDPALISIQPDDVVQLDGTGPSNRTIESVQSATVEVRLTPSQTEENVAIARVWLVQPVGLTPEELDREKKEEELVNCQRQLYEEMGFDDAAYLARRAVIPGTPAPDEELTP